jgi:murein DD-endopeptidase MepM/ murein hydrolase activator NlpD
MHWPRATLVGLTVMVAIDPSVVPMPHVMPRVDRLDPAPRLVTTETAVRAGDTLERALLRSGLDAAQAREIGAALRGRVDPRRLHAGERIRVGRTDDGRVASLSYWPTPERGHAVRRDGDGWTAYPVDGGAETRVVALTGRLASSLFATLAERGEAPVLSGRFVELFEWDFDFAADCLPSDRFRLLVEKRYVDGEFVAYGDILAAQYRSEDRPLLTAIAFRRPGTTAAYYDLDGRSVRKAFLRAPLEFTRVSSGYSHARLHPILGGVMPHLAIDYAAPVGTPVRAVADGVVVHAGWDGGNGLSILLRHAHGYRTMYNHLSRLEVRSGQRVTQRQLIGRVGATGLATGPHLDYRVMKDGRWVNPLGERFVPGDPVSESERDVFAAVRDDLLERLEREAPFREATATSPS